jgi:hypothetical protein
VGVTFLEPNAGKYRPVLRVYPYMDASDGPNYIFDLQRSPNGDTRNGIGWSSRRYRGFGHRYVMPQVDAWVSASGPDDNEPGFSASGPVGSLRATDVRRAGFGPGMLHGVPG